MLTVPYAAGEVGGITRDSAIEHGEGAVVRAQRPPHVPAVFPVTVLLGTVRVPSWLCRRRCVGLIPRNRAIGHSEGAGVGHIAVLIAALFPVTVLSGTVRVPKLKMPPPRIKKA